MAITHLGFAAEKIKLSDRIFYNDPNGLERIEDTYYFPTSLLGIFQKTAKMGVKQSDVALLIQDANTAYDTLYIERIDYTNIGGGLTCARVTYVGLFSTQNPAPVITINPVEAYNYVWNKWTLSVEFIAFIGEPGSNTELTAIKSKFSLENGRAPREINGYKIPQSIEPPSTYLTSALPPNIQLGWLSCPRFYIGGYQPAGSGIGLPCIRRNTYGTLKFLGMTVQDFSIQRFGKYGIVNITWADSATYVIGITTFACGGEGLVFGPCQAALNFVLPETGF